jgi:GNAT superfamily N-acetyltransferase
MSLRIFGLERYHDRADFDCGEPALNTYLQRLAGQHTKRDFSRTYVAESPSETSGDATRLIKGFYAISSGSIDFKNLPATLKLPRYPVPVARIGRLAVDLREQGKGVGVGAELLAHAMQLTVTLAQQIGLYALVVDTKHESAAAFYARYGFQRFADQELSFFLTTDVIRRAMGAASVA